MDLFILILLTLLLILSFNLLLPKLKPSKPPLPPGPSAIAFFAENVLFKRKSIFELEQILLKFHSTYGPIISLRTLPNPTIFIQSRDIAHQALVQNGITFADRPPLKEPMAYLSHNGHDINSSSYGPLWRLLRRNLTSEMLHPSRIKLFSPARRWALQVLIDKLSSQAEQDEDRGVLIMEDFKFMMFRLFVAICFGEKLDDEQIKEIQAIQYSLLRVFTQFNPFAVLPRITRLLFSKRWEEIVGTRRRQAEIFVPLIRARRGDKKQGFLPYCYVDSLLDVEIPEEGGRKLTEDEIVNLCHELLSGGTDTTSTGMEWIMAELVRNQDIQRRLVKDIERVVPMGKEIEEEDMAKMPYLKAVIMEGLRRHPPGHFVLPHRTTEDVKLTQYLIPKGSEVHINVAQLGWDARVWEEPMEFRPERFMRDGEYLGEIVDLTGSREIKMMPFGAGRRMCPGYGLATLHLEYFVANLVREFEWKAVDGEEVDLSEDFEFTTIMKNHLRARIQPRRSNRQIVEIPGKNYELGIIDKL